MSGMPDQHELPDDHSIVMIRKMIRWQRLAVPSARPIPVTSNPILRPRFGLFRWMARYHRRQFPGYRTTSARNSARVRSFMNATC